MEILEWIFRFHLCESFPLFLRSELPVHDPPDGRSEHQNVMLCYRGSLPQS